MPSRLEHRLYIVQVIFHMKNTFHTTRLRYCDLSTFVPDGQTYLIISPLTYSKQILLSAINFGTQKLYLSSESSAEDTTQCKPLPHTAHLTAESWPCNVISGSVDSEQVLNSLKDLSVQPVNSSLPSYWEECRGSWSNRESKNFWTKKWYKE